ncbi:MAG: transglycosylase domain-containing protein [Chloroflexota bacterium]
MSSFTRIIAMRQRRRARAGESPAYRLGLGCSGLVGLVLAVGGILLALGYASLGRDLPSIEGLPALLEPTGSPLLQPTRLYDRSGEHLLLTLEHPATAGRQYLHIPQPGPAASLPDDALVSTSLITATLAAADPGFWQHPGFAIPGLQPTEHPTLAQRLAAEFLLENEPPSWRRGLRERLLAAQVTARFGRQQVLEWYLNSADYGHLAFGVDAAARLYLDKPAAQLSLAEAALLAAAGQSPDQNPLDNPQAALERQKLLIQEMLRLRWITPEAGIAAARQELALRPPDQATPGFILGELQPNLAPTFTSLALRQLESYQSLSRLARQGLKIITTLDYNLQTQSACAAQVQLARLSAAPTPTDCAAARLLPSLASPAELPPGDLKANLVVLDPQTGQVLALVSDPSSGLEALFLPEAPPGSLITPVIYLTAFTRGLSPASLLWDLPGGGASLADSSPQGDFHGPLRLRMALANDYLAPAQAVMTQIGARNVWRTAQQLGLVSTQAPFQPSETSLDSFPPLNLLKASQAFGIWANQGVLVGRAQPKTPGDPTQTAERLPALNPLFVLRIESPGGQLRQDWSSVQTRPILTPQLTYLLTHVLSDETARWPSLGHPNPLEIGRPAAAKIGATADGESNWTIGYTPERVTGVWLGLSGAQADLAGVQDSLPLEAGRTLPNAAAGLWHAVMNYASRDLAYQPWEVPAGISSLEVCDPSGLLPTTDCPNIVTEVFLAGNEPVQTDNLYRSLPVNRETGRLATIFTPPDLIDGRVYLIAPPEAEIWARRAGLPVPPDTYDVIPAELPSWEDAAMRQPAPFAVVRGQVSIYGTAGGQDFSSYRLQAGQGLNPQFWLLIGQDMARPVKDGLLGTWDTSEMNGLYAIQLLVVRRDQSVHRATVLVSVDNQPPEVEISYPLNGAQLDAAQSRLILQVEASDDLGLQSVTLYLDDTLLTTFIQPPYALSWGLQPGEHHLRAVATDQAGNTQEAAIDFTVNE